MIARSDKNLQRNVNSKYYLDTNVGWCCVASKLRANFIASRIHKRPTQASVTLMKLGNVEAVNCAVVVKRVDGGAEVFGIEICACHFKWIDR